MAHNLYTNTLTGQASMFYAADRGRPWHGLGQSTAGATHWEEAMRLAQLDWTVSKQQLFDATGKAVQAWGTFRDTDNAFLGTVGSGYAVIQNRQAFDFIDTLIENENGAHYESAGALGNGSHIWALARVKHDFRIANTDDTHETYLLFETAHDGTMSATCKLTTVRVVCQNTLNAALRGPGISTLRVRHTANGTERLEAAKRMIGGIEQTVTGLKNKLDELAKRKVAGDKTATAKVMEALFGDDWRDSTRKRNQVQEIAQLFHSNDRDAIPQVKGTAYNLLNAVTEWSDHFRSVRTTEDRRGMGDRLIRKQGAMFEYDSFKDKALDAILAATEQAPRISMPMIFGSVAIPPAAPRAVDSILSAVAV